MVTGDEVVHIALLCSCEHGLLCAALADIVADVEDMLVGAGVEHLADADVDLLVVG